mgnify:CR=1 FL=1
MTNTIYTASILVFLSFFSCGQNGRYSETFYPMGGIPVTLTAWDVSKEQFDTAFEQAKDEVNSLEGLLSSYVLSSDVSRVNKQGSAKVEPPTLTLIDQAVNLSKTTEGAFDITISPVIDLWKNGEETGAIPNEQELSMALNRTGSSKIKLSRSKSTVTLSELGMKIDLGGIAKGYIAQRALSVMTKHGISRGIVDAGGDVVMTSGKTDKAFRVGIKNPRTGEGKYAILSVASGAVVTSGCSERTINIGNKRYCHIIDPRTGKPVSNELLSITVLAKEASAADAYATALYVLGSQDGFALAKSLPEIEAVFLYQNENGQIKRRVTPGLKGKIEYIMPTGG